MIRVGSEIEDIQRIFEKLLKANVTAPWTSWEVILNYPESSVFETFTKPFIYIESPEYVGANFYQGAKPKPLWEMIVGAWDIRKQGGTEEINIICSQLLNFLNDPQAVHTKQFTIALGGTTYTNKTLIYHGVTVLDARGARVIATEDPKHFRRELYLTLRT